MKNTKVSISTLVIWQIFHCPLSLSLEINPKTNPSKNELYLIIIFSGGSSDSNNCLLCNSQNTFKYISSFTEKKWRRNKRKYHRQLSQTSKIKPSLIGTEKARFSILPKGQEVTSVKKSYD